MQLVDAWQTGPVTQTPAIWRCICNDHRSACAAAGVSYVHVCSREWAAPPAGCDLNHQLPSPHDLVQALSGRSAACTARIECTLIHHAPCLWLAVTAVQAALEAL